MRGARSSAGEAEDHGVGPGAAALLVAAAGSSGGPRARDIERRPIAPVRRHQACVRMQHYALALIWEGGERIGLLGDSRSQYLSAGVCLHRQHNFVKLLTQLLATPCIRPRDTAAGSART
jgi:hypothetical protein